MLVFKFAGLVYHPDVHSIKITVYRAIRKEGGILLDDFRFNLLSPTDCSERAVPPGPILPIDFESRRFSTPLSGILLRAI